MKMMKKQLEKIPVPRKKPVTIAIGIIGKKSISMAADSRTTRDGFIQNDAAQKLNVLELAGAKALIAQAGNEGNCQRTIEIMEKMAKGVPLSDYRTVADLARKAMMKVLHEIKEYRQSKTDEDFERYFQQAQQQSYLMIAHFFEGKPYIYVANLFTGQVNKVADRDHAQFAAIGTGAEIAGYILDRLNIPEIDYTNHATNLMVTAMYVVQEATRKNSDCGGSMMTGMIHSNNEAGVAAPCRGIDHQLKIIKTFDKGISADWTKKMEEIIAATIKSIQSGQPIE